MKVTINVRTKTRTRSPNTYIQPNTPNNLDRSWKPSHFASRYKQGIELINSRKLLKSAAQLRPRSIPPDPITLSTKHTLPEKPKLLYLRKRPKKLFPSLQLSFQNSWVKLPHTSIQLNLKGHVLNNRSSINEP